jgi:hypothetical protein
MHRGAERRDYEKKQPNPSPFRISKATTGVLGEEHVRALSRSNIAEEHIVREGEPPARVMHSLAPG